MSGAEIYFRLKQTIGGYLKEKFRYKVEALTKDLVSKKKLLGFYAKNAKFHPNTLKVFGADFNYGNPQEINWQEDFLSREVFLPAFYRKINIRVNPKLSAKCVWEINRLQFLVNICINYKITNSKSELNLFIQINKSWSSQNPFLSGINWYSNIEINLRLITWFLCWEILDTDNIISIDDNFKEFVENTWLPLIKRHCIYSYENPSKYSSANNHLISEYAGLFIASSKWEFKESEKWVRYSHEGLEKEIINQHSKEGINKEEAAEYIQFITDFFLLCFIVGEKTNKPFSERYNQQLYKIFSYIYNFLDCNGNFPKYGDEDDGKCFIFEPDEKFNNFKSLLTSGAIMFNDPVLKSKCNGFDLKNHLLFGDQGKLVYESIPDISINESSKFYREEGHFIFRKRENGKEIYLHFDAAPLGFLSIAAHGHSDALSFILHIDGEPIFIDSGTYTYHTEPEWRSYFIGTLAHNTVRINQKDQSVNGGPTLWIKHYETSIIDLELSDEIDRVKATHNGYIKESTQHIREIVFDKLKNEFQIFDTIDIHGRREITVEIPFHIHPEAVITQVSTNSYLVSKNNVRKVEFYVDEKLDPVVIKGQVKPHILGWYSNSFMKKEATSVIYCKTQIECTTTFKFLIKIV
jgi:hypothetical protein